MAYFEQVNGVAADYLLGGGGVPVLTQNVKAAVGEYKRGQVLENNAGTFQKLQAVNLRASWYPTLLQLLITM